MIDHENLWTTLFEVLDEDAKGIRWDSREIIHLMKSMEKIERRRNEP